MAKCWTCEGDWDSTGGVTGSESTLFTSLNACSLSHGYDELINFRGSSDLQSESSFETLAERNPKLNFNVASSSLSVLYILYSSATLVFSSTFKAVKSSLQQGTFVASAVIYILRFYV